MVETRNRTQSWTWTRGSCRVQVDRCTAAVRGCEEARWLAWCRPISQFSLHEQRIQTLQEPLDVSVKVSLCHFLIRVSVQHRRAQWLAEPAGQQEMRSQGSRNSPVDPD